MKVSTKGRYALRLMTDIAAHDGNGYVSLKDVAERQNISMKYLEMIVGNLKKARLVDSTRGKDGGYKLNRGPGDYSVGDILRCIEDNLAPVACIKAGSINCENAAGCMTVPMWKELDDITNAYLDTVSLEDLLTGAKWRGQENSN